MITTDSPTLSDPEQLAAVDPAEVFDAVAEALLVLDAEGVVTGWNSAAEDMFGYTAVQAYGQPVEQLLAAEYHGRPIGEAIAGLLAGVVNEGQRQLAGAVLVHHRDGRPIHAQVRLSALQRPGGPMVCAFLTDVTTQVVTAEAAIRAAEVADTQRAFALALLDSLTEGVIALNSDGNAVVFNRALRRLVNVSDAVAPQEAMTTSIRMIHHLDGTPMRSGDLPIARAISGHTVRDAELVLRIPGLPDRYLAVSSQPILAANNRQVGAVATVREITARHRTVGFRACELAVTALLDEPGTIEQRAPAVLRTVAQTLRWPYAELRLADSTTDTLNVVASYTAPGYQIDDLRPDRLPRTAPSVPTAVWNTGQAIWAPDIAESPWMTGPQAQARARAYTQQGLRAVLSVPVPDGEEPWGVLTCFADTAEHDQFLLTGLLTTIATQFGKFLADQRAAALTAELDRTRADFTALVGHDMRTPLTTIATYTQLLLDDPDARSATDQQLLDGINRSTTQLRGLVDALLDLAALEAGDHTLDTHPVDLSALLHAACDHATPAADTAGLTIAQDIQPDVHINGDPDRLAALADALLAATIAADSHGRTLQITLARSEDTAHLTVTAPGGHVVDPFGRFSPANTTGTDSAAPRLGLALARVIAERHGGVLTVTDQSDAATVTVTVRLPLAPTTEPPEHWPTAYPALAPE